MDELISTYVENTFTEELKHEIYRSFSLFDYFEHQNALSGLIDILNDASYMDSNALKDKFVLELHSQLDYVLQQHNIRVTPEATLEEKNEIISALALIQNLEDYSGIITLLESFESDDLQLATILSDLCMLDYTRILSLIEYFDPHILQLLKDFIYSKENEAAGEDKQPLAVVANAKLFFTQYGKENIGGNLIDNDVNMGSKFETYLPFVDEDLVVESDEQTAMNILSLLYLSIDGYNAPLLVYRKYSYQLLHDLNRVSKIETLIVKTINLFEEFKKAHNEKARLSQTSDPK